jgi:hypothetical protein
VAQGATLSLEQGWELAKLWYKDRLRGDWQRPNLEEAQILLASLGLSGRFWDLAAGS